MGVNLAKKHFNDYFMIYGLIFLSLIPAIARIVRTLQIINNETAADNLRFISNPSPMLIHIISSSIFSILGAFQFSKKFRINYSQWHKYSVKLLLVMATLVSISGLWMTRAYALSLGAGTQVFTQIPIFYIPHNTR